MSLSEPLTAGPSSELEVGSVQPQPSQSTLSGRARSIILSLTLLCSLLVAALAVVLFLFLSPSSPSSPSSVDSSPAAGLPFFTTGNPHPIGQPPFIPRESTLARVGRDMDFSRNLSVDPCDDFYHYACGGWIASQTLPPGRTMITKGFELAGQDNTVYIREVIEADWPIVTPFFQACMNVDAIQRLGFEPAKWFLDALDPSRRVLNRTEVYYWMGRLRQQLRLTSIFSLTVGANATNPRQPVLNMGVGGTTFTPLSYYYGPSNITARIAAGISAMLLLAGDDAANAPVWARRIVDFETGLIKVFNRIAIEQEGREWTEEEWGQRTLQEERDNLAAVNNYFRLDELEQLMPNTPIRAFFDGTHATSGVGAG